MRTSWFDDKAEHEAIQERASKLESFTSALADGVVSKQELTGQEQRLVAAMKTLEPVLSDELHAQGHRRPRRADGLQRHAPAARAAGRACADGIRQGLSDATLFCRLPRPGGRPVGHCLRIAAGAAASPGRRAQRRRGVHRPRRRVSRGPLQAPADAGDLSRHPQVRRQARRLLAPGGDRRRRRGARRSGSGSRRSTRRRCRVEPARSRAAAARDRLADPDARRRSGRGRSDPDTYSSGITNTAYLMIKRAYAPPDERLRLLIAREKRCRRRWPRRGRTSTTRRRSRPQIAIEQLDGSQRVLQDRRGGGVSRGEGQGAARRVQGGERRRHRRARRLQEVAAGRSAEARRTATSRSAPRPTRRSSPPTR